MGRETKGAKSRSDFAPLVFNFSPPNLTNPDYASAQFSPVLADEFETNHRSFD